MDKDVQGYIRIDNDIQGQTRIDNDKRIDKNGLEYTRINKDRQ